MQQYYNSLDENTGKRAQEDGKDERKRQGNKFLIVY